MRLPIRLPTRTLLLVFSSLLLISTAAAEELPLADLIEKSEPACVRIDVKYKDGSEGFGSGFVVDTARKWVVTNYHVVGDSKSATVVFPDGAKAEVEGWRAHYTQYDLALLQIKTDKKLTALPLAAQLPRKGERVVAIGTPKGLSFTASEGIVSGIREGKELDQFGPKLQGTWLQTSAPISPGSSGGPLLGPQGEVVGVNSAFLAGAQNLNFAISCDQIRTLVDAGKRIRLRELALLTPVSEAGGVPRKGTSVAPDSLVIKIPSERRFRHRYKIEEKEDEFDKLTWLRTEWLKVKHDNSKLSSLGVRLTLAHDEGEAALIVIWEIGATARSLEFHQTADRRFQVAGGGESYELPVPNHTTKIEGNVISEVMTSISTLRMLTELVLTDNLKARLGNTEMEFGKSELECLRELVSKIPTGELANGKIRIERLAPEEDPTSPQYEKPEKATSQTESLFNGKDLTGWHTDVPDADQKPDITPSFIVRDGILVSLGNPRGHLITDQQYENYRLEVEYRFPGEGGPCGVLVHASRLRALYAMYPQSIEVQMNSGHAGDFWCIGEDITVPDMVERRGPKEKWGITEGKARRIRNLTDGSEKPVGEWNTLVIECVGDEIKVWVNDDFVNHGTNCTAARGQIVLQAEGAEVEFRKLSLTPIEKLSD